MCEQNVSAGLDMVDLIAMLICAIIIGEGLSDIATSIAELAGAVAALGL